MKERYRKQKFLKNVGLQPFKIQRYFHYFFDQAQLEVKHNHK